MDRTDRIAPAWKLNVKAAWRLTVAVVAALVLSVFASSLAIADTAPFHASYQGTFQLAFGTGPGGTNVLAFSGTSGTSMPTVLGPSTITGKSFLEPTSPCSKIVADSVTLTAANGDTVSVQNTGQDCVDKGRITGSGTYTITGGSGRFMGASGTGTFSVSAQITSFSGTPGTPGSTASGTFNPLTFDGTISVPCNQ
jgi:hypothetical protein